MNKFCFFYQKQSIFNKILENKKTNLCELRIFKIVYYGCFENIEIFDFFDQSINNSTSNEARSLWQNTIVSDTFNI